MGKTHTAQLAGPEHKPQDLSTSQGGLMLNDVKSAQSSKLPSPKAAAPTKGIMISWLQIIYGSDL